MVLFLRQEQQRYKLMDVLPAEFPKTLPSVKDIETRVLKNMIVNNCARALAQFIDSIGCI